MLNEFSRFLISHYLVTGWKRSSFKMFWISSTRR